MKPTPSLPALPSHGLLGLLAAAIASGIVFATATAITATAASDITASAATITTAAAAATTTAATDATATAADFYRYTTHNPDLPASAPDVAAFAAPTGSARPQTWWHWINGNVSRDGIAADLRAMAENGFGAARIFSVNSKTQGPLLFASPEWFDTFRFTVETAARHGLEIGIHNCDGWSEAGGPWIAPEQSMQELTWKLVRVTGPAEGGAVSPKPPPSAAGKTAAAAENAAEQTITLPPLDARLGFARDIAVLAWPAKRPALLAMHRPGVLRRAYPANEYTRARHAPVAAAFPAAPAAAAGAFAALFDGEAGRHRVRLDCDPARAPADTPVGVVLEFAEPFEAAGLFTETQWSRSLPLPKNVFLEASDDGARFEKVLELKFLQGDLNASFAPRRARFWRLVRHRAAVPPGTRRDPAREDELHLSELELLAPGEHSRAAFAVENLAPKAGMMEHRGDFRPPAPVLPESFTLQPDEILNLTANTTATSINNTTTTAASSSTTTAAASNAAATTTGTAPLTLRWRVPAGEWMIMRIGHTTTGRTVRPATPGGRGLEVDKFEPSAVGHHFDSYPAKMIAAAGPLAGKTFSIIETDSWEAGHQNWTENFPAGFRAAAGYDIIPWLPVFAGECIQNLDATENFLRDLRRAFSSLVMKNFYGVMASRARAAGLKYETEPAGGSYMRDPMNSFRLADYPMTEAWQAPRAPGLVAGIRDILADEPANTTHRTREPSSAAHFYGKQFVTCEALTSVKGNWAHAPWTLKGTLDSLLFAGPNLAVFHSYTHQPDERAPGWQMEPWGIAQNRKMPWWPLARPWFDYIARVQYMLQQGKYAARVLYLYADEIPSGSATLAPGIPHQYDVINGDGLRDFLRVENGRLTSPGRMHYDLLIVSPRTTLRLETLEKLRQLAAAGAAISAEKPPAANPTLTGGPAAAARHRALAVELFGADAGPRAKTIRRIGTGLLLAGHTPAEALAALALPEAFTFATAGEATAVSPKPPQTPQGRAVSPKPPPSSATVAWLHREHTAGAEWFWIANRDPVRPLAGMASFAVAGKTAALWHPETGATEPAPVALEKNGRTLLPLTLEALEGVFVVFTPKTAAAPVATDLASGRAASRATPPANPGATQTRALQPPAGATISPAANANAAATNAPAASAVAPAARVHADGAQIFPRPASAPAGAAPPYPAVTADVAGAVTVTPAANRRASRAAASGIISETGENFALYPEQMHARLSDPRAACAGLSVGKNSIAVFEHGASYRNSIIVWNHPVPAGARVAVVYQNNLPALYVNGEKVASAARPSGRAVRPPAGLHPGFKGRAAAYAMLPRAASPAELTMALADAQNPARLRAPRLFVARDGRLAAEFAVPGALDIETAAGARLTLSAAAVPAPRPLPGPFAVTFDPKWGAPASPLRFDQLVSWTDRPEPGVKHYSGAATYATTFEMPPAAAAVAATPAVAPAPAIANAPVPANASAAAPAAAPDENTRVYLEIEQVAEIAQVRVNGRLAGTLWRPPYRLDITEHVRAGANTLDITVANTWVNRCLHDATLPAHERLTWAVSMQTHYPASGTAPAAGDYYPWKHGPLPSGLIGEMRLVYTKIALAPR
jgi:hypothetical protein